MQCHLKSKRGINNTDVFWVLLFPKQSEPLDLNHVWTHDGIALHILMVFNLFFKFYSSLISCFTCICLFRIFFKMKISNITLISCYYELKAYTGIYIQKVASIWYSKKDSTFLFWIILARFYLWEKKLRNFENIDMLAM